MPKSSEYSAVYMDRRSLMYLRQYLECEGEFGGSVFVNIDTAHVARRLKYAGILESFTGPELIRNEELGTVRESWEGHASILSPLGEYLKAVALDMFSARSAFEMNFWTVRTLLDIWPLKWLEEASAHQHKLRESPSRHSVTNFMSVFQMEFPLDESIRQYLRDRIRAGAEAPIRQVALPAQFVDVPVQVDRSASAPKNFEDEFSFDDASNVKLDEDGFPLALTQEEPDAADFDFGADDALPDEEAGNQDQGADEEAFEEDGPTLTPEEEADGWSI